MADLQISVMAAQPFTMPAVSLTVSDSTSTRTTAFSARVARMFLASVSGGTPGRNSGTEADPDEWIKGHLQYVLNNAFLSNWTCTLTTDGRLRITYNGTGTGTITWDGSGSTSLIPRYLAGWDANVSLGAGASATGTYPVTHAVFCVSGRANSEGWNPLPKRSAIGQTDNGLAYAFVASTVRQVFTSDWRFFPFDQTAKTALSANGTVYQPSATARWTTTSATPSTSNTPPWSLIDFFSTVHGKRCGVALGNFQALVAGSDTAFFDVTFDRSTLQAERPVAPSAPDWSQRVDWKGVTLRYVAHKAR